MSDLKSAGELSAMISNTPLEGMAKDYAKLRLEVPMLKTALSTSQQQYAQIMLFIMAVLRQMPEYTIRFNSCDLEAYSKFKDSWVLESGYDEGTDEEWLRLREKGEATHA
jgi:hypothetical protein